MSSFVTGDQMDIQLHDTVRLKKAHPCGCRDWEIIRVGADLKLKCLGCGREVMRPREEIEKKIIRLSRQEETAPKKNEGPR